MLMNTFMQSRKSVRDFKRKKISTKDITLIQGAINTVNEMSRKHDVVFSFYEDGKSVFEPLVGRGGYRGRMIEAPAYIAMELLNESEEAYIFGAFYMEDLITKLQDFGLGSCWVTLTDVEEGLMKSVFNKSKGNVHFALALGYTLPDINIGIQEFSTRLGLEDFIYFEDFDSRADVDMLENYGLDDLFYYLRFAPSTMNRQPWRFLIKNDNIELFIEDYKGVENLVDAGIIMYYYVKLARARGIDARWYLNGDKDINNKKFIGRTNF